MTSWVTMTTTPVKKTSFHVLSNGLHGTSLAGGIELIYFFFYFFLFFYKEPVLNVPEQFLAAKHIGIGHIRYINILAWLRGFQVKIANFSCFFCPSIGLLQQTITWYKISAMLKGKLIIILALGH